MPNHNKRLRSMTYFHLENHRTTRFHVIWLRTRTSTACSTRLQQLPAPHCPHLLSPVLIPLYKSGIIQSLYHFHFLFGYLSKPSALKFIHLVNFFVISEAFFNLSTFCGVLPYQCFLMLISNPEIYWCLCTFPSLL